MQGRGTHVLTGVWHDKPSENIQRNTRRSFLLVAVVLKEIRNHGPRLSPPDLPGSHVTQEPSGHFQPIRDRRHVRVRKYGQGCGDHARGISLYREHGNAAPYGVPIQTGAAGEISSLSIWFRVSHHGS